MSIIPKGWRTIAFNIFSAAVTIASAVLQYLDMLGLEPTTFGLLAIGLTVFTQLGNMYLRSITSTPMGQRY